MKQLLSILGLFVLVAITNSLPLDPVHPHLDTFKSAGVSVLVHDEPKVRSARDYEGNNERFGRFVGLGNGDYGYHGDTGGVFPNEFEDFGGNFGDASASASSSAGAGGFVF